MLIFLSVLGLTDLLQEAHDRMHKKDFSRSGVAGILDIIVSFFWTCIVLVVLMEWDAVTSLVRFQSTVCEDQLAPLKHKFNQKWESWVLLRQLLT